MYPRILVVFFSLALFGGDRVLASQPTPPLETIIQQVIARDEANQQALKSMQYHQTLQTERLDENNRVIQHQELQMIIRPGAPDEVQVLSEKGDNLPANPDEAALQAQGHKAQKQKIDITLKDLANRFNISLAGTDTFRNQPAYVLSFEPKPNQPYRNQTEKVLNHLRGRMWISPRDYSVLKTEATLAEPVEIAWVFAQISALSFRYELNDAGQAIGPARVQTSVQVAVPFLSIRQRMTINMDRFQPRPKI